MIENFFVWRCSKQLGFCRSYCAPLLNPTYPVEKEKKKKKPFVPWVSFFFLSLLCLLKTHEEVWWSLKSRSLFISSCQPSRKKPCVSKTLLPKSRSESATKQGQTLQIKDASIQTHTHRQHHRRARAIVPAPQKFKSACCYSIWFFFLSLLFWWRKRSRRWKAYLMFIAVLGWRAFRVLRQYYTS